MQRQQRVEHSLTALCGAAVERQRVVWRERDVKARLSPYLVGYPTSVTTDIEHASIGE
jgi:hypothetical protein